MYLWNVSLAFIALSTSQTCLKLDPSRDHYFLSYFNTSNQPTRKSSTLYKKHMQSYQTENFPK